MIRLIVALIGAFVIWVLFFSHFSKKQKIAIVFFAVMICISGIWYENASDKPRHNIVQLDEIVSCGVSAVHTYRSNFDISLCLQNQSKQGHIKRIKLAIIAEQCSELDGCTELQRVIRDLSVDVPPNSFKTLIENLSFNQLDRGQENIKWRFETEFVKAKNE